MISTIINAYFSNININKYPVIIDVHLQWKEGHDKRQSCIQDCILILLCFKLFCWCEATKIFPFQINPFEQKNLQVESFVKKILSDTTIHLDTLVNKKRKKEKLEKPRSNWSSVSAVGPSPAVAIQHFVSVLSISLCQKAPDRVITGRRRGSEMTGLNHQLTWST